jgi:glucokinase
MDEDPGVAVIGIDVGGTDIKGGLVRPEGQIVDQASIATEADGGVDHVIGRMVQLIEQFRGLARSRSLEVETVGLGIPGTLSRSRGMVVAPPNLVGWRNVPVVERVKSVTGLRVMLDNDADCAALGEFVCGAGREVRDMVLLTLGTGIGGGIILAGKPWHGATEGAGELGHTIVQVGGRPCQCGQLGCLEAYASGGSTAARATERIAAGERSSLKAILDRGETIEARQVVEASAAGDTLAGKVWEETCRYLAAGCISIHHAINPQRIVLAGGMSAAGDQLLGPVFEAIASMRSKMLGAAPDIRLAELGNDAGLIGAALSALR